MPTTLTCEIDDCGTIDDPFTLTYDPAVQRWQGNDANNFMTVQLQCLGSSWLLSVICINAGTDFGNLDLDSTCLPFNLVFEVISDNTLFCDCAGDYFVTITGTSAPIPPPPTGCCPGVTIPSTVMCSFSGCGTCSPATVPLTFVSENLWQGSTTCQDGSGPLLISLICNGSTWRLEFDCTSPGAGTDGANAFSVSCSPLDLRFSIPVSNANTEVCGCVDTISATITE